ncbi:MAG: alpha/beta hydrolase [Myxococcota bacterium]|jgi:hypothetical protein|nr:alpha/beta hydrolase [Myxococcota bacterium]
MSRGLPILFLLGTRDRLCPLELLEPIRRELDALSFLHVVEGGDHSLNLSKKAMREQEITQSDADHRIASGR